jgi:hypothetical protein
MNLRRILMNAADASPGSGAAPAVAPTTEPQAQGAAPLTMDSVAKLVADALVQQRNSIFAEMRRGRDDEKKPAKATSASSDAAPDVSRLRQLDRALARTPHASKLSDSQYARLERAFVTESPDDASSWLTDYFGDVGSAAAPAAAGTTAPNSAATAARTGAPASDGGAPAASQVPVDERRIVGMSQTDVEHLVKTKGPAWLSAKLRTELKGVSVRVK